MLVLGIETSCDESALALVDAQGTRASLMVSQIGVHALFGGVVPEIASREHARLLGPLLQALWEKSGCCLADVQGIAVTRGPGLLGCLLVGMSFAKALALGSSLPLVGVNHLHAHLLVAGLQEPLEYPALGVLVSGGHTHLYRMESPTDMQALGKTLDDAAGEACDKFAKMVGLPYPGGALVDALGQRGVADPKLFPKPLLHDGTLDFSFSGLKTAASVYISKHPEICFPKGSFPMGGKEAKAALDMAPPNLPHVAASFLHALAQTLRSKAEDALKLFSPRCLVVAGGVAANSFVRAAMTSLCQKHSIKLMVPSLSLCTDNGVMVAHTGRLLFKQGLHHNLNVSAIPRGQKIPCDYLKEGVLLGDSAPQAPWQGGLHPAPPPG